MTRADYRVQLASRRAKCMGIPHDVPVLGFRVNTCGRLRLWRAVAAESFDFYAFNTRRPPGRGGGEGEERDPLQGALSQRRHRCRAAGCGSSSSTSS
jgi:hypothetical protein